MKKLYAVLMIILTALFVSAIFLEPFVKQLWIFAESLIGL